MQWILHDQGVCITMRRGKVGIHDAYLVSFLCLSCLVVFHNIKQELRYDNRELQLPFQFLVIFVDVLIFVTCGSSVTSTLGANKIVLSNFVSLLSSTKQTQETIEFPQYLSVPQYHHRPVCLTGSQYCQRGGDTSAKHF
jgi:hypothetical protein